MDAPGTAIEQYFNHLIHMQLLSQVIISDRQGNTILACFGHSPGRDGAGGSAAAAASTAGGYGSGGAAGDDGTEEDMLMESNVALSGARCYQNLDQLQLGVPSYISAQYHDGVVVQTLDRNCLLSLIGSRSKGHYVGGLLALLPQIQSTDVYREIVEKVDGCFQ